MSNLIRNMQKRRNGTNNEKMLNKLKTSGPMSKGIDFNDRILPRTLLVDVKSGSIKLGNETDKLVDIKPFVVVTSEQDKIKELISVLAKYKEENCIDKVILDNQTDFKIKSLEEFYTDVVRFADQFSKSQIENDIESGE